jgi:hypothetical protein
MGSAADAATVWELVFSERDERPIETSVAWNTMRRDVRYIYEPVGLRLHPQRTL